jgi:hypothetical protein
MWSSSEDISGSSSYADCFVCCPTTPSKCKYLIWCASRLTPNMGCCGRAYQLLQRFPIASRRFNLCTAFSYGRGNGVGQEDCNSGGTGPASSNDGSPVSTCCIPALSASTSKLAVATVRMLGEKLVEKAGREPGVRMSKEAIVDGRFGALDCQDTPATGTPWLTSCAFCHIPRTPLKQFYRSNPRPQQNEPPRNRPPAYPSRMVNCALQNLSSLTKKTSPMSTARTHHPRHKIREATQGYLRPLRTISRCACAIRYSTWSTL